MKRLDDFNLSRSQWNALINEWIIGKNAERDRALLRRRLFDGICFEELAEEFDLSTTQAKTIVYESMNRIIKHL